MLAPRRRASEVFGGRVEGEPIAGRLAPVTGGGAFIEIGGLDGVNFSDALHFEQKWDRMGIVIEGRPFQSVVRIFCLLHDGDGMAAHQISDLE